MVLHLINKVFVMFGLILCLYSCTDQIVSINPINTVDTAFHNNKVSIVIRDSSKKKSPKNTQMSVFGDLIKKLNLSVNQKNIVDSLIINHTISIQNCMTVLYQGERDLFINYRVCQDSIRTKLKFGLITRAEANRQFTELKDNLNIELLGLTNKLGIRKCLKSSDILFLKNLQRILNKEQLLILNKWEGQK